VNFIDSFLISLFDKKDVLARISHKLPTAAKDKRISTALRLKKCKYASALFPSRALYPRASPLPRYGIL